jgi:protein phosphatase
MSRITPFDIMAGTHTGLVRASNEDSYVYAVDEKRSNSFIAVADGIGGHERGDLASKICTKTMFQAWQKSGLDSENTEESMTRFLKDEIKKTNQYIYRLNKSFNIQNPMGTTLVSAIISAEKLFVAHAGDSRLYRLRDGHLECLTQDHSFVAELIKRKIISREESKNHPFAHIISKSIGTAFELEPDLNVFDIMEDDRLLFCTDGINIHIEDPQIEIILEEASDPYSAVKNLIYSSLRGGGEDNITVICVFL